MTPIYSELQSSFSVVEMLPGVSVWEYLKRCREQHPKLYALLSPTRVSAERVERLYRDINRLATHFESKLEHGRGDSYRQAQDKNYLVRSIGFLNLFDLAISNRSETIAPFVLLDALGGNGTLTKIVRASRPSTDVPYIVTSDVSARMIESALAQNLPAIRFPLQDLIWFRDDTFDCVIIAYGTHHIPPNERNRAVSEAYRVLKPKGSVVVQDFEIGQPTTLWYEEVLDRYTCTGHKYKYFTRNELRELLLESGLRDVRVENVYDPFVLYADDPQQARREILEYVFTLFALEKLDERQGGNITEDVIDSIENVVRQTSTFEANQLPSATNVVDEFTIRRADNRYRAEIPRVCLAAVGNKP